MALHERLAPFVHDLCLAPAERKPWVLATRRRLLRAAEGRVLEVGAGTGFNLPHYPAAVDDLTLTDALEGMVRRARRRAGRVGRPVVAVQAPAERLPYEDGSFDTVVCSLLLCSVDDQDRVLAEIRRVLRPGGRYLFLEHVRSDDPRLARRQNRLAPIWRRLAFGCRPNRDTLPRIEAAFTVDELERGEAPIGPSIVRPYVLGVGRRPH